MTAATVPPSIRAALAEANALWPARSKVSDGTIGDALHAARASDHNPDANGIIHAFDLTHDPQAGVDCGYLSELVRANVLYGLEHRVAYLIWDRRIFTPAISPNWRPYTGTDPHLNHLHCSIRHTTAAEGDTSSWWTAHTIEPGDDDMFSDEDRKQLQGIYGTAVNIENFMKQALAFQGEVRAKLAELDAGSVTPDEFVAALRTALG